MTEFEQVPVEAISTLAEIQHDARAAGVSWINVSVLDDFFRALNAVQS